MSKTKVLLIAFALSFAGRAASGEELDAAKLDQARSLAAEGALLEEAAAEGRVTEGYAAALRETLNDDLQKLANEPRFAAVSRQALAALARHDAAALAAIRDRLVAQERLRGRAG